MIKKLSIITSIALTSLMFAQDKVSFSKEQLKKMDDYLFDEMLIGGSTKKPATIILKDGSTVEGLAKDVDYEKGLLTAIEVKNDAGKSQKYKSAEIAELYLPVAKLSKAAGFSKYMSSSKNWGRKSLSKTTNPNEVYMRNIKASIKNKKEEKEYLLQLINPDFSSKIEVYGDPRAKETGGVGFSMGGFSSPGIGGGVTKSYYVKKDDNVLWLEKGDFKENYNILFGDNDEFLKKYPYNSIKWEHFSFLVMEYTRLSTEGV